VEIDVLLRNRLELQLRALSPAYQQLIYERFVEGRSLVEIAGELGVPAVTVRTRLLRAVRRLRSRI
jgi:RNA polymerase sigma-70 factor (ECF subfamily)